MQSGRSASFADVHPVARLARQDVRLGALGSCSIASEMVMGEDLAVPQLVGGAVNWLQCAGMVIPSALTLDGEAGRAYWTHAIH